jgi:hypothetical protein
MTRKSDPIVEIDYKNLGTIALDELKQALWEDIEALRDQFGVSYVTGVKLLLSIAGRLSAFVETACNSEISLKSRDGEAGF